MALEPREAAAAVEAARASRASRPDVATARGAEAVGLASRTGVLAAGMHADIVLLDTRSLRLAPVNDAIATIVLLASPADVDTVIVAGRILVERDAVL